jgi:hypothetical protein
MDVVKKYKTTPKKKNIRKLKVYLKKIADKNGK